MVWMRLHVNSPFLSSLAQDFIEGMPAHQVYDRAALIPELSSSGLH